MVQSHASIRAARLYTDNDARSLHLQQTPHRQTRLHCTNYLLRFHITKHLIYQQVLLSNAKKVAKLYICKDDAKWRSTASSENSTIMIVTLNSTAQHSSAQSGCNLLHVHKLHSSVNNTPSHDWHHHDHEIPLPPNNPIVSFYEPGLTWTNAVKAGWLNNPNWKYQQQQ